MSSPLTCPSCHRPLRVPDRLRGQAVRCPACLHTFTAPGGEAEPRYEEEPPPVVRPALAAQARYEDGPLPVRGEKPGKVQAMGVMMLVGGILATLGGVLWLMYIGLIGLASLGFGLVCCLW